MYKRRAGLVLVLFLTLSGINFQARANPSTSLALYQITLESVSESGVIGNDLSQQASISANNRYISFSSWSTNLIDGQTYPNGGLYIRDMQTGHMSIIPDGGLRSSLSATGQYIAFTAGSDLIPGDPYQTSDVDVRDLQSGTTIRASAASDGTPGNDRSEAFQNSITPDGRYVAFYSYANNLVTGDTNGVPDIFVHDMQTGATWRVSIASDGTQQDGTFTDIEGVDISADGRYVVFESSSPNLVPGAKDTNNAEDIFIHDNTTGVTTRESVASDGTQSNGGSLAPVMSDDGRYIAFESDASNLVPGDNNGFTDIFVRDLQTGVTKRVSLGLNGQETNGNSIWTTMSADGRYISYTSYATNIVQGYGSSSYSDVYRYDQQTGITSIVSVAPDGSPGNYYSMEPFISADGNLVAFFSYASNFYPGSPQNLRQAFVREMTNTISGHISDANNNPVSGVSVSNGVGNTTVTDSAGAYAFANLTAGTYSITPTLAGRMFTPASLSVSVPPDQTNMDFVANPQTYLVAGYAWDNYGDPIKDVKITNEQGDYQITDNTGFYTFSTIPVGAHTFTPTLQGYSFNPISTTLNVNSDIPDADFTGTRLPSALTFLPGVDGYNFVNSAPQEWYTDTQTTYSDDFTDQDLWKLFGNRVCESIYQGYCILNTSARDWYNMILYGARPILGGHCDGMSVEALRIFEGLDQVTDFQSDARSTYMIKFDNARKSVSYDQIIQWTPWTASAITNTVQTQTPTQALNLIRTALQSNDHDALILHLAFHYHKVFVLNYDGAHALVPYGVAQTGANTWQIWVYDPNHPNETNHYVNVDTAANTWSYVFGAPYYHTRWDGDASTRTMNVIPISSYLLIQSDPSYACPWCIFGVDTTNTSYASSQNMIFGANVIFTDASGNQLGYVNGQLVDDIPGSSAIPVYDSGSEGNNLTYYLPTAGKYKVSINGQTITQTQRASFAQFGPGYSFSLDGQVSPTTNDQLSISSDGKNVGLETNEAGNVDLTLTSEVVSGKSLGFHLNNLSLGAGQTITITNDTSGQKLKLDNSVGTDTRTYDLVIDEITADGSHTFNHTQIALSAGDIEYLSYGSWDGQGDMSLQIDHGSDGTINETITLSNNRHLLLPLLMKDQ